MKIPLALFVPTGAAVWSWTKEQQNEGMSSIPLTLHQPVWVTIPGPQSQCLMAYVTDNSHTLQQIEFYFQISVQWWGKMYRRTFLGIRVTSPLIILKIWRLCFDIVFFSFSHKQTSLWCHIHLKVSDTKFKNGCGMYNCIEEENFQEKKLMLNQKKNVEPAPLLSQAVGQSYTTSGAFHTHYQHHNSAYWAYEDKLIQLHTQQITCSKKRNTEKQHRMSVCQSSRVSLWIFGWVDEWSISNSASNTIHIISVANRWPCIFMPFADDMVLLASAACSLQFALSGLLLPSLR